MLKRQTCDRLQLFAFSQISTTHFTLDSLKELRQNHLMMTWIASASKFLNQLLATDFRNYRHRLHFRKLRHHPKDIHRIKYPKAIFANLRTKACSPTKHLLKQDPRIHPPQKHNIANRRHINARSQQIHRHRDFWQLLIFIFENQFQRAIGCSRNLLHCLIFHLSILSNQRLLQQLHHQIRMIIRRTKN